MVHFFHQIKSLIKRLSYRFYDFGCVCILFTRVQNKKIVAFFIDQKPLFFQEKMPDTFHFHYQIHFLIEYFMPKMTGSHYLSR